MHGNYLMSLLSWKLQGSPIELGYIQGLIINMGIIGSFLINLGISVIITIIMEVIRSPDKHGYFGGSQLGFPMRNIAIIAQNLLCSWLTYLYKLKIHLVACHNKNSYWCNSFFYFPVFFCVGYQKNNKHFTHHYDKTYAYVAIAVYFLNG